jgi:hypothetical protein
VYDHLVILEHLLDPGVAALVRGEGGLDREDRAWSEGAQNGAQVFVVDPAKYLLTTMSL